MKKNYTNLEDEMLKVLVGVGSTLFNKIEIEEANYYIKIYNYNNETNTHTEIEEEKTTKDKVTKDVEEPDKIE